MNFSESTLVLIRHGQSKWNKKNLFTGWKNPGLTKKGEEEAISAGIALKNLGYKFDVMFTSDLIRAQKTGELILEKMNLGNLKTIKDKALNERDYGNLSGLNKEEARKKWGKEQVHLWRRSYDIPPPGGESLKDTSERVMPYFKKNISPLLKQGKQILITAHGNSLRALVKYLDNLDSSEVVKLELQTGIPIVYKINSEGVVTSKTLISLNS